MKKFLTIYLVLACSGSVLAEKEQQNYLCITEMSVGFRLDETTKKWHEANYTTGNKYLIKINDKEHPLYAATVAKFGSKEPFFYCEEQRGTTGKRLCEGFGGQFVYNLETLRFLRTYLVGYVDEDNNNNNPAIFAGTCTPL